MRDATDGEHQRVIRQLPRGQQFRAILIEARRHLDKLALPVDAGQFALLEFEVVPARLRHVLELVRVRVHAAGRHLVQQRLPDVRGRAVDQRHLRRTRLAKLVAQPRDKLEPAGSATDHDDPVCLLLRSCHRAGLVLTVAASSACCPLCRMRDSWSTRCFQFENRQASSATFYCRLAPRSRCSCSIS
jgi:hypothetical protein